MGETLEHRDDFFCRFGKGDVSLTPVSDNGLVSDEGTTNDANQVSVPVPPSVTDQANLEGESGDVLGDTTAP